MGELWNKCVLFPLHPAGNRLKLAGIGINGVGSSATNFVSKEYWILSRITQDNYDKSIPAVKECWEKAGPRSKKDLFYVLL